MSMSVRWGLGAVGLAAACSGPSDRTDAVDPPVQSPPSGFVARPVACADPSGRQEAAFDRAEIVDPPNDDVWLWSGGLAVGDFTGDGRLDMMTTTQPGIRLFDHAGNARDDDPNPFIEVAQPPAGLEFGVGGSVADYDGDGDLDLYVTRFERANALLQNQGDGSFVDVTAIAGVAGDPTVRTLASAWSDFDRDGDLDLFVGNYGWVDDSGIRAEQFEPGDPSVLYRNEGDGTFTDVTSLIAVPAVLEGYTYVGTWFDPNRDGWPDLYIVDDFGPSTPNVLLWNRGGTFEADDGTAGLNLSMSGMGVGLGDTDGDGTPDLLIPEWENIWFLQGNQVALSDGSVRYYWVDRSDLVGIQPDRARGQQISWGAELADLDNDGDLDGAVAFGHIANDNPRWANGVEEPDALWVHDEATDTYVDQGLDWGIADLGASRGFAAVDLNDDGWLDLVKRNLLGNTVVYTSRCGTAGWLRVRLHAPGTMNTGGVGARIEVDAGGRHLERYVVAGSTSHATGGPPEVQFGLGDADTVDHLAVVWPDGERTDVDAIAARQIVDITR